MLRKTKGISLLLFQFILVVILGSFFVGAEETNFDFSFDCEPTCKDSLVNTEQDFLLKLTLKNNFNYWVYSSGVNQLYISVDDPGNNDNTASIGYTLSDPLIIPPKSEIDFYIEFDEINKLSSKDRIGDWSIKPTLRLSSRDRSRGIKYFPAEFNSEEVDLNSQDKIPTEIPGNFLKFEVARDEIEVEKGSAGLKDAKNGLGKFFDKFFLPVIIGIVIMVAGTLLIRRLTSKKKTSRKRRKK